MISIIIPSYKEKFLRDTIETIEKNTKEKHEVIVVSSSPEDDSFAEELGARIIEYEGIFMNGEAKNIGAKNAVGDVLVFLDAHVWLPEGWEEVARYAMYDDVGIATSALYVVEQKDGKPVHLKDAVGYFPACTKDLDFAWARPPGPLDKPYEVQFAVGCFQAIEKKKFESLGIGFVPYWGYEDREISCRFFRLGYKIVLLPNIKVGHYFKTVTSYPANNQKIISYAKSHFVSALLDFEDDTLGRLEKALKRKGVTKELADEVLAEENGKWLHWRKYYKSRYKVKDTAWWSYFGIEPP